MLACDFHYRYVQSYHYRSTNCVHIYLNNMLFTQKYIYQHLNVKIVVVIDIDKAVWFFIFVHTNSSIFVSFFDASSHLCPSIRPSAGFYVSVFHVFQ